MRPTHLMFDFFGTLNQYSHSLTDQGYARTHRLLLDWGADISYDAFLVRWQRNFEDFEAAATASLDEYSMDQVCTAFLHDVLRKSAQPNEIAALRDTYLAEWSGGITDIDGLPAMLQLLSETYVLALISNTHDAPFVHARLRMMRVDRCFTHVVTSIEHGKRKPSPLIFDAALRLCRASPSDCLYIGDSYVPDYCGATAAGIRCLLIDPAWAHSVPPSARLGHILDLPALLAAGAD